MLPATRHARRRSSPALLVTALLAAIFAFAVTSVALPGEVFGATHGKVALCSANLRTSASVGSRVRAVIKTGTPVSAVTRVTGRHWQTSCAGKSVAGSTWFRISAVNGKSVKSIYGVTYLYAATGLFKAFVPPAGHALRGLQRQPPDRRVAGHGRPQDHRARYQGVEQRDRDRDCVGYDLLGQARYREYLVSDHRGR